jgi:hypothetical protein
VVKLRWDLWFYGLVSAVVGGGAGAVASAVGVNLIAPDQFNLSGHLSNTIHLMLAVFAINSLFSFFTYLAKHPAPEYDGTPETDRRALQPQAPPALPPAKP